MASLLLDQRGHLFAWTPVCLGSGIGLYFALPVEPPLLALVALACLGLSLVAGSRWLGPTLAPLSIAIGLMAFGVSLAGARAHAVAGPQIDFRYYGPVEGRIVGMDRSATGALRLTLDHVHLHRIAPEDTPRRVRISLHGQAQVIALQPGMTVILTGHLSVAQGPVEPGGFDFRRHTWFQRLGAVGYTRLPVLGLHPPDRRLGLFRLRMAMSSRVQAGLPGQTGAFAAAILTGDRSGMTPETLQALRASNLAHLLAISGLHMGLLAGFVFGATRLAALVVMGDARGRAIKKLAAAAALVAAFGYLLLSGGNVATERAFIMVAVALCAIMADRRPISLRAVAMAALVVLLLRPESLLGPGFQMSFAATTALVIVFSNLWPTVPSEKQWHRRLRPVLAVVLSSAVAGAATAPVAMAHFNQIAHYGLVANLLSVPLMGVVVVPAGVLAALLMPFGLEGPALWVMGLGLGWIEFVAQTVSSWPGALGKIKSPPAPVLPLLAMGALIVGLWQGRPRWLGVPVVMLAALLWWQAERPAILISSDGRLVGIMTEQGRALSKPRGQGFVARVWLENDGDAADQPQAAARWAEGGEDARRRFSLSGAEVVHLLGKTGATGFDECRADQIVISSEELSLAGPCRAIVPSLLRETGAIAIAMTPSGIDLTTVRGPVPRIWQDQ